MKIRTGCAFIFGFSVFILTYTPAFADQYKLKSGQVYEGKIIDSDNQSIFIETPSGLVNVPKKDLAELPAGIEAPKSGVVLKPAWGKKNTPSSKPNQTHAPSPTNHKSPPSTNTAPNTSNGKVYGMDLMKLQQEAAQSDIAEMKEMFQKAAILDARHAVQQKQENQNLVQTLQKNKQFGWAINWALEASAKSNLRKVASAASVFTAEKDQSPKSIQEIITSKFLDDEFKGAVNGYQFTLTPAEEGCLIHAIPADPSTGLQRFTLNSKTGKIQTEK